jgi:hypothetical protein
MSGSQDRISATDRPRLANGSRPARMEVAAIDWWQANAQAILGGPGTQRDKADALGRLGPAPDANARITITREGEAQSVAHEQPVHRPEQTQTQQPGDSTPSISPDRHEALQHTVDGISARLGDLQEPLNTVGRKDERESSIPTGAGPDDRIKAMIVAIENTRDQVSRLQVQLDSADAHDNPGAHQEITQQIQLLDSFANRIQAAISKQSHSVNLTRTEVGYAQEQDAAGADSELGPDEVAYLQQAEQEYAAGLGQIEPVLHDLREAGVEVETRFAIVSREEHERRRLGQMQEQETGLGLEP